MKKKVYLLVALVGMITMSSCGAGSSSCASADKYQIKNIKFENQQVVLTDDYIQSDEKMN